MSYSLKRAFTLNIRAPSVDGREHDSSSTGMHQNSNHRIEAATNFVNGKIEILNILSARQRTREEMNDKNAMNVILNVESDTSRCIGGAGSSLVARWVHLHQPTVMDLESFRRVAIQEPSLTNEDRIILQSLFDKLRNVQKSTIESHMRYLQPNVLEIHSRYDDNALPSGSTPQDALFMCFPYFSLQQFIPPRAQISPQVASLPQTIVHPTRTLLQSQYDMESTEDQDQQKVRKQQRNTGDARIVHVAQAWVMVCGKNLLLTCANIPQSQLLGKNMTIDNSRSKGSIGYSVKVTNLDTEKTYCITLKEDKTWLEFLYHIELLQNAGFIDNFPLESIQFFCSKTGIRITEAQWPSVAREPELEVNCCTEPLRRPRQRPSSIYTGVVDHEPSAVAGENLVPQHMTISKENVSDTGQAARQPVKPQVEFSTAKPEVYNYVNYSTSSVLSSASASEHTHGVSTNRSFSRGSQQQELPCRRPLERARSFNIINTGWGDVSPVPMPQSASAPQSPVVMYQSYPPRSIMRSDSITYHPPAPYDTATAIPISFTGSPVTSHFADRHRYPASSRYAASSHYATSSRYTPSTRSTSQKLSTHTTPYHTVPSTEALSGIAGSKGNKKPTLPQKPTVCSANSKPATVPPFDLTKVQAFFMWPTERHIQGSSTSGLLQHLTVATTAAKSSPTIANPRTPASEPVSTTSTTVHLPQSGSVAHIILDDIGRGVKQDDDSVVGDQYNCLNLSSYDIIEAKLEQGQLTDTRGPGVLADDLKTLRDFQKELLALAKQILECFVPTQINSEVVGKYWGAVENILKYDDVHTANNICSHLTRIRLKAEEIQRGVCSTTACRHPSYYCIPRALVEAFQLLLRSLVLFTPRGNITKAQALISGCEWKMQEGVLQLFAMLRMGDFSQGAIFELITRDTLVRLVLQNLLGGVTVGSTTGACEFDVLNFYLSMGNKLNLQIHKSPRRQLLVEVHSLAQDLDTIQTTLAQQQECLASWPQRDHIGDSYGEVAIESRLCWLSQLQQNVNTLPKQLLYLLDANKDNNDRTIFAFTAVTVVFLPLSFVSSYFGMNSVGIRDTAQGSWVFWAAAMPITIGTMVLTLFVAYRYERIKDWMENFCMAATPEGRGLPNSTG